MSYSTVFKINKKYEKVDELEYGNSWLFSPIVFDELYWKYLSDEIKYMEFDGKMKPMGIMSSFDNSAFGRLNEKMNNSKNLNHRILWELANQQIFENKDFDKISAAIEYGITEFILPKADVYGEHISERWHEMAKEIKESECAYIIHKNTSVDDGVQILFEKYNEDDEEYELCPMYDSEYCDRHEFVLIDDDLMGFELAKNRFSG